MIIGDAKAYFLVGYPMRQKVITCSCGQANKVAPDYHDRMLTCVKCHKRLPLSPRTERSSRIPTSQQGHRRIGELLVEQSLITSEQLNEALHIQAHRGEKIVETLISLGYLDLKTFMHFLARQPGIASIDLGGYEVPSDLVSMLPREFAMKHEVFPIDKMGCHLTVGMVCPLDAATIAQLEVMTGLKVKALLCLSDDIHAAIDRYYPSAHYMEPDEYQLEPEHGTEKPSPVSNQKLQRVESGLTLQVIVNLIKKINSLPPLPATVQHVREAMESPEVSVKEVAKVVSMDPPSAAKLLSLANSPAYGFVRRVSSVHAAVSLLGLRETYSVVMAASAEDFFEKFPGFDHNAFWRKARFCAMASVYISQYCGLPQKTGIFAAGLLHDMGRLVLACIAPERFAKLDATLCPKTLLDAELAEFHIGHTEVGAMLAEHWQLPPEIAEVMRFHHDPASGQEAVRMVAVVALADLFYDYCRETYSETPELLAALEPLLPLLDLKQEALPGLHASLLDVLREE